MAELSLDVMTDEGPDISHIITEDDTPVDNLFSEKQQRLLARSLNTSWKPGRSFVAASDVGVFYEPYEPPIVPDMFLSMDVRLPDNLWEKKNRSYFIWEYGKPPEVAVEIVSNREGGENKGKLKKYQHIGVLYYIIFDPQGMIQKEKLRIYELSNGVYLPKLDRQLIRLGLGVTLWEGIFENQHDRWLRWIDHEGNLIETGEEQAKKERQLAKKEWQRAEKERQRADMEHQQAEKERLRADMERQKAEKLAQHLRAMGIDPDGI